MLESMMPLYLSELLPTQLRGFLINTHSLCVGTILKCPHWHIVNVSLLGRPELAGRILGSVCARSGPGVDDTGLANVTASADWL